MPSKRPEPWDGVAIPDGYRLDREGVSRVYENKASERICGPAWISAQTTDQREGTFGVVLNWIDMRGKEHDAAFPRDVLHEQGRTLPQTLSHQGLQITPGKESALVRYFGSFEPDRERWIRSTARTGWLESRQGELVFVHPSGVISSKESELIVKFQPEQHSPTIGTMREQGSLQQWQTEVAELCRGNPVLIFCLSVAFAAPLLQPAGMEGGGFHLYGRSSSGKTTAAQVAASVWGCGADPADAPQSAYTLRWNMTGNAQEALAAAHNHLLLVLDEIHTCDHKDFGALIYNLLGGKGKAALDRDRVLRPQRIWSSLLLSTGEISVRQKIEEGGKQAHAGQLTRLVDIPTREGIILDSHGLDQSTFVGQLKHACTDFYGIAGPEFIRRLIPRHITMGALSAEIRHRLANSELSLQRPLNGSTPPEQQRALKRFALTLVAGELAADLGVLPFDAKDFRLALRMVIDAWRAESANLPDVIRAAQSVQAFLLRYQQQRFPDADKYDPLERRDIAGFKKDRLFLFTEDGFREACKGYDIRDVASELKRQGLLKAEHGRLQSKHTVTVHGVQQRPRFYAVDDKIIEHDFTTEKSSSLESTGASGASGAVK